MHWTTSGAGAVLALRCCRLNGRFESSGDDHALHEPPDISLAVAEAAILGKTITVTIDRPLGSKHPEWGWVYPVNYGHVAEVVGGDGEDLDAYVLGVDGPLTTFTGRCVAVIACIDDVEVKLLVVPDGVALSDEEIGRADVLPGTMVLFEDRAVTETQLRWAARTIREPARFDGLACALF